MIESLASGTPLVVTRVGAIPEVIADGVEGIIVEPRNPKMVADALRRLIQDRILLRKMSYACVRLAHDKFDIKRFEKQLGEIYNRLYKPDEQSYAHAANTDSRE